MSGLIDPSDWHFTNQQVWENASHRIRHEQLSPTAWRWVVYRKEGDYTTGKTIGSADTLEHAKAISAQAAP